MQVAARSNWSLLARPRWVFRGGLNEATGVLPLADERTEHFDVLLEYFHRGEAVYSPAKPRLANPTMRLRERLYRFYSLYEPVRHHRSDGCCKRRTPKVVSERTIRVLLQSSVSQGYATGDMFCILSIRPWIPCLRLCSSAYRQMVCNKHDSYATRRRGQPYLGSSHDVSATSPSYK